MEDACAQHFGGCDDVIVLSSDETQDKEDKERLMQVRSKVRRKVRRRLLQNKEIKELTHFGDRNWCSSGEDNDNGSHTGICSDDLTITQFESPTKNVFTLTKTPRIGTLSDCSDDDEAEKEGYIRYVFINNLVM